MNSNFISPTGYVDLDNDCEYSIDNKSTRSREYIDPKEDLAFYFNTYITPKYGLENINVSNVASFMKDLDMNWTKLTPDLKEKVLDIMVEILFKNGNFDFKTKLSAKIGLSVPQQAAVGDVNAVSKSTFGNSTTKSNFGPRGIIGSLLGFTFLMFIVIWLYLKFKKPSFGSQFSRF